MGVTVSLFLDSNAYLPSPWGSLGMCWGAGLTPCIPLSLSLPVCLSLLGKGHPSNKDIMGGWGGCAYGRLGHRATRTRTSARRPPFATDGESGAQAREKVTTVMDCEIRISDSYGLLLL